MLWVRRTIVFLLSLILLVTLVGEALAFSAYNNLTHAAKIEVWLNQSHVYDNLVTNAINDAQQNSSNDQGAGRVSLNDPQVQQAIRTVFSTQLLQQQTQTFLSSNYAWLEGKTKTPDFSIDLSRAKEQLAIQVGQQVKARVSSLPACTVAQLNQLQATLTTDPLTITCLPPSLTADTAANQATEQISSSRDFLTNPIITASSLNPNGNNQGQPYYQKLSSLPKLYQLELKSPWIFGGVALVSLLGILFLSSGRRRGLRWISLVLVAAGLIVLVANLLSNTIFNDLEKRAFSSNINQLQKSLTVFLKQVETHLMRTDLWFAIAYLVIAIVLLLVLWLTRNKVNRPPASNSLRPRPKPKEEARPIDSRPAQPPTVPAFKQPKPRGPRPPTRLIQ